MPNSLLLSVSSRIFELLSKTRFGWSIYAVVYFTYKRYIEDPYYMLLSKNPMLLGDGHILDIGANIGYNTRLFSRFKKKNGSFVHAFEPDPVLFPVLLKTTRKHSYVKCINMAVSNKNAEVKFLHNKKHLGDNKVLSDNDSTYAGSIKVSAITIDKYVEKQLGNEPVSFAKLDIQGHELAALEGMRKTIESNEELVVCVELCKQGDADNAFNELLEFLKTNFKTVYQISKDGKLLPLDFDAFSYKKHFYIDVLCVNSATKKINLS